MNSIAMHSTTDFGSEIVNNVIVNLYSIDDCIWSRRCHNYAHRDIGDVVAENEYAMMSVACLGRRKINAEPRKGSENVVADRQLVAIVALQSMKAVHRGTLTAVLKFQTIDGYVRHRGTEDQVADDRAPVENGRGKARSCEPTRIDSVFVRVSCPAAVDHRQRKRRGSPSHSALKDKHI